MGDYVAPVEIPLSKIVTLITQLGIYPAMYCGWQSHGGDIQCEVTGRP